MNPVTVKLLSEVEKYHRSKQAEALQLRNQAQAERPGRPPLLRELANRLGTPLVVAGQWLKEWKASLQRIYQAAQGHGSHAVCQRWHPAGTGHTHSIQGKPDDGWPGQRLAVVQQGRRDGTLESRDLQADIG